MINWHIRQVLYDLNKQIAINDDKSSSTNNFFALLNSCLHAFVSIRTKNYGIKQISYDL